jgi:hypothetical protein
MEGDKQLHEEEDQHWNSLQLEVQLGVSHTLLENKV